MKRNLTILLASMMALTAGALAATDSNALTDEEKKQKSFAALLEPVDDEVEEFYTVEDIMFRNLAKSHVESAPEEAKGYVQGLVDYGQNALEQLSPYTPIETSEEMWTIDDKEYTCYFKRYDLAPEAGHSYFDLYYVNDYNFNMYYVGNGTDVITGEVCPNPKDQKLFIYKRVIKDSVIVKDSKGKFYMYTPDPNYVWGSVSCDVSPGVLSMPRYSHAFWSKYVDRRKYDKNAFIAYGNKILECEEGKGESFRFRNGNFYYDIAKDYEGGFDSPIFNVRKYYRYVEKDGNEEKKFDIQFHVNDTIKNVIKNGKVLTFLMNENDTVKFSTQAGWVFEYSIHRPDYIARKRHNAPSTIVFLKNASIGVENIDNKRVPIEAGSVLTCLSNDIDPRYETWDLSEHLYCDDRFINNISDYLRILRGTNSKITDPTGDEVFYTNTSHGSWMWKYANEYKAREEARQKEEEARQAEEIAAQKKPIYDAYCAKYGKKYVDAALNGNIIIDAPIAMIKELFEYGLFSDHGSFKTYDVITDIPEFDLEQKKIVRRKYRAYPSRVYIHT